MADPPPAQARSQFLTRDSPFVANLSIHLRLLLLVAGFLDTPATAVCLCHCLFTLDNVPHIPAALMEFIRGF